MDYQNDIRRHGRQKGIFSQTCTLAGHSVITAGIFGLALMCMVPQRAHAEDMVPVISADGQIKMPASPPVLLTESAPAAEPKMARSAPELVTAPASASAADEFVSGRAVMQKKASAEAAPQVAAQKAVKKAAQTAELSAVPAVTPSAAPAPEPSTVPVRKAKAKKQPKPQAVPQQAAAASDMEVTITLPNGRAPTEPTAVEGQAFGGAGDGNVANVPDGTVSRPSQMALMDAVDVEPKLAANPEAAELVSKSVFNALENHPLVKGRKATAQARDHEVRAERSAYYPVVSVDAYTGWHETENNATRAALSGDDAVDRWESEGEIGARQLIWDFGVTDNRVEAAKSREAEAGADIQDGQEEIALRAAGAYLDVLRALENLELSRLNVAKHEKTLEDVQLKEKAGAGDGGDVAQTESRLALARAFLIQYEESLLSAQAGFREAVGYLPAELTRPQFPELQVPPSIDEAITDAYRFNNGLRSASYRVEAFGHDAQAEHDRLFPRLDVDVSHSRGEDTSTDGGTSEDTRALLRLSWDFPTGGEKFARHDRASNLRLAASERLRERQRQVEEDVRVAYTDLHKTGERLEPLKQRVAASEMVVNAYKQQFEAGRRTLLDTLDSENELFLAKIALNDGEYEYLRNHYRLFAASGRLREALGITR